jgi:hypothetical protein
MYRANVGFCGFAQLLFVPLSYSKASSRAASPPSALSREVLSLASFYHEDSPLVYNLRYERLKTGTIFPTDRQDCFVRRGFFRVAAAAAQAAAADGAVAAAAVAAAATTIVAVVAGVAAAADVIVAYGATAARTTPAAICASPANSANSATPAASAERAEKHRVLAQGGARQA